MASSLLVSSSTTLLPSLSTLTSFSSSSSPPKLFTLRRHTSTFTLSSSSSSSIDSTSPPTTTEEKQRLILESYGLNPSDFISEDPSPKSRRRSGEEKVGRGKRAPPPLPPVEEKKPPRATHKLLQVLGGTARRRKLLSPKGMDVRPMMEVVKGAAFAIIQSAGGYNASLRPGRWLDLYSGTGSVGIEAISRGCAEAHFVEMDPWVVSEVLRPNLEWTGFLDNSVIHTNRVESFLEQGGNSLGKDISFDYISVTPPYTAVDYSTLMEQLGRSPLVGEDCFILVEYPLKTLMSDSCGHLIKIADRRFGRTNLLIYGPTWAQKKKIKTNKMKTNQKRPSVAID